ncbi:MAG: hypothetical protein K1Y36_09095 [Blastocatellia bacterium]|nr:hypothetical protein [Blastocatellia bacterium]
MGKVIESVGDCRFQGEWAAELKKVYTLIERLWQEHRTSPTGAGDEKIYAFGNLDYIIIISQDVLGGLVELKTRVGNLDCTINDDGVVECKVNVDPKDGGRTDTNVKQVLDTTVTAMELYYYGRKQRV